MSKERFFFGQFGLNPEDGVLVRQGVPVPVSYRGLLLLTSLIRRAGEVLKKSDLMDAAWPGMAVEEGNLSVQIMSLRKLLGPSPDGGEWIATVPRVGYRFVGAMEKLLGDENPTGPVSEPGPSIAVLPFDNLSDDAEKQYFAEGLAEDIITRLGRLRWLLVSARNSSFAYKGKAIDGKQVGRELGVRYVLNGSVRHSGQQLRVGAQLSDVSTGLQVWAERYDLELTDFFALQDQIAESVIAAVEPRLFAAEHQRFQARTVNNLDAWGYVMKAMPYVWTWGTERDIEIAQALLKKAIDIDPDYSRANSLLAWTQAARVQLGWDDGANVLPIAGAIAQRAIQRDPEDPWAHFAAGYVHMVGRGFNPAVAELSEALELNPSMAFAHTILGSTFGYGGLPMDGLHHLAIAMRLSPRDYAQAGNLASQGLCHFMVGRFSQAVDLEQRAIRLRPHFGTAWRTLAASAGMAGDRDTASYALSEAMRLHPSLSVEWVENCHPIVHSKDRAIYIEGLRVAGLR
jgi:TolB-like protein/Tfp pilus assembly protein PilF